MDVKLVFSVLVVVLLGAGLAVAERRRRLLVACVGILVALATGWGLAARAVAVDYRDADGAADCWPYCTPFQDAVWATLFYAPVAAVLLLVTATALYALRRRRSRSGAS